jgi:DNA-binding transcriptional MerR regulator
VQVWLTASQLAKYANVPKGSLGYYVAAGLLLPSVRRASTKGQPHIFGFEDVVIARTITQLRLATVSVEGMRGIAGFWRSDSGRALLSAISAEVKKKEDGSYGKTSVEKVFVVLSDGTFAEDGNRRVLELTRDHRSPVIHVVDAGQLVEQVTIDLTEAMMRHEFVQPGPGGRVPRERKPKQVRRPRGERTAATHQLAKKKSHGAK